MIIATQEQEIGRKMLQDWNSMRDELLETIEDKNLEETVKRVVQDALQGNLHSQNLQPPKNHKPSTITNKPRRRKPNKAKKKITSKKHHHPNTNPTLAPNPSQPLWIDISPITYPNKNPTLAPDLS